MHCLLNQLPAVMESWYFTKIHLSSLQVLQSIPLITKTVSWQVTSTSLKLKHQKAGVEPEVSNIIE